MALPHKGSGGDITSYGIEQSPFGPVWIRVLCSADFLTRSLFFPAFGIYLCFGICSVHCIVFSSPTNEIDRNLLQVQYLFSWFESSFLYKIHVMSH